MELIIVILCILNILLTLYLIFFDKIRNIIKRSKNNKGVNLITTLQDIKLKDDMYLERDKDLVLIDEYIEYISCVLDKFNNSRNKKVSLVTKKDLVLYTIKIVPIFSKFVDINVDMPIDKSLEKCGLRELMELLESAYNDYTHDNLGCINTLIPIVLKIRDCND